ncbi:hypothetical protein [Nonomuraea sp. LPB2021202275-12-8]
MNRRRARAASDDRRVVMEVVMELVMELEAAVQVLVIRAAGSGHARP